VSKATSKAADSFPIRVDQRGAVAVWTIDREDRRNALSRAVVLALGKLAREPKVLVSEFEPERRREVARASSRSDRQ